MKLARNTLALVVGIALTIGLTGCSGPQLERQAETHTEIADASRGVAQDLRDFLDANPPGTIEDSLLAQGIRDALPERFIAKFDAALAVTGNARAAARELANDTIPAFAENQDRQAAQLFEQAAAEAEEYKNFFTSVGSVLNSFAGPGGILAALTGGLAALAGRDASKRRRERDAAMTVRNQALTEREREREFRRDAENMARRAIAKVRPEDIEEPAPTEDEIAEAEGKS